MFVCRTTLGRAVPAGVLLVTLGSVALTGCGSTSGPVAAKSPAAAKAAAPLTVTDPWVKAAGTGMTGAFGTLVNSTDQELTVVSAASSASGRVELHEVVGSAADMKMRPKAGGFVVPAKGSYRLQPGGDHIMLMGIGAELKPGAEITVTLTLKDGRVVPFTAVVKAFAGGKENYQPGGEGGSPSMSPGGGMHGMGDMNNSDG